MTPEQQQLRELQQKYDELSQLVASMRNATEVDPEFQTVLDRSNLSVSSKGSTTENKTVNEGGVATYNVLTQPDGFLEIEIAGTTYYVPYFG